jgi:hypothetical protein
VVLNKDFVLSSSDTDSLTVLGNNGDTLQINNQAQWDPSFTTSTDAQGATFKTYTTTDHAATLVVDAQVQVVFHA